MSIKEPWAKQGSLMLEAGEGAGGAAALQGFGGTPKILSSLFCMPPQVANWRMK